MTGTCYQSIYTFSSPFKLRISNAVGPIDHEHGEWTWCTKKLPASLYNTSQGYRFYLEDFTVVKKRLDPIQPHTHLPLPMLA